MRTRIKIDSATPGEVYAATLAFQVTTHEHTVPRQLTMVPTVTVEGTLDEMETFALRLYEQCIRKRVDLEDAQ